MRENPAGAVYGTIVVGALLAAETAQQETYLETVGAVVLSLLLYWLAHSYAEFTGRRLQRSEPLTLAGLTQTAAHELSVLFGGVVPLVAVLLSWAFGARLTTAVSVGIWSSAAMIFVIELTAAIRARRSRRDLVAQTSLGALLGLLVITLHVVLH